MRRPESPAPIERNELRPTRSQGDFLALFLGEQRRLYRFIRSLVPHAHDAEDVLQETAAILWQEFDKFAEGTNFYAWSCQVAHFRILKHRQKWSRSAALLSDDVLEQLAALALSKEGRLDPRHSALETCLEKLPAQDRTIVTQRYDQQMTGREVADRLGRPANAVYKSLGRIRRTLLACIARELDIADREGGDSADREEGGP
jgi:RNA polymerase sigma-70 factor (ECF subfamily)